MIKKIKLTLGRMSYRDKLLYFQVCFILIIGIMISISLTFFVSDSIMDNEEKHLEQLLQVVNEKVSGQIEVFDSVSFDLLVNQSLKNSLNQTDSIEYGRAFHTITSMLSTKTFGTIGMQRILIIDRQKHVYSTDLALLLPIDFDIQNTEVYKAIQQYPGELVWLTENDIYDRYGMDVGMYKNTSDIHAAAVIQNYISKEVLGILILSLDNNYFSKMTFSDDMIEGTNLYLVSPDKKRNYKLSGTEEDLDEVVLKNLPFGEENSGVYTKNDNIISYRYNKKMNWYLVSVTETRFWKESIYQLVKALVLILGIEIIVFILVSNYFFKTMTKGIDLLVQGMMEVERGNFDVAIESNRTDEIGKLTNAFNHMVRQINELIISKYQQELLTQKAEIQALQAQINPHFFYNTLDMLSWQLVIKGEDDLSNTVISIGNLFRYSISSGQMNVSLKEELGNVRDYLAVQFSISGKMIDYIIEAEDEEHILLPRLSLQPLVENAVTHGFKGRENNNRLFIHGYFKKTGTYVIEVEDNGIGIPEEKVKFLEEMTELETSAHVGIANVRKRIMYLYEGNASMTIKSQYGYGTTIIIELPVRDEGKKGYNDESGNC